MLDLCLYKIITVRSLSPEGMVIFPGHGLPRTSQPSRILPRLLPFVDVVTDMYGGHARVSVRVVGECLHAVRARPLNSRLLTLGFCVG